MTPPPYVRPPQEAAAGSIPARKVLTLLALLGAWIAVAFWVIPEILEAAYRGEGLGFITAAMDGRDIHSLQHYQNRWGRVAWDGTVLALGAGVAALLWSARRIRWDEHWFRPGRLTDLATARLVLVGVQLALILVPALPGCSGCSVGDHQLLASAADTQYQPVLVQRLLLAPFGWGMRPDVTFMATVKVVAIVAGALALAGPFGRAGLVVFAWSATLLVANTYSYAGEYHHSEGLLLIALWALTLAPSYEALSFRVRAKRMTEESGERKFSAQPPMDAGAYDVFATWPLRLMQWLLALTYFDAGAAKLLHADFGWFQPSTLGYYLARDGLMAGSPIGIWMSEQAWLIPSLAVATVVLELCFFVAVLVPRSALIFVLAMTALHVAIFVAQWAPFPQHVALLWVAFLPSIRERAWRTS